MIIKSTCLFDGVMDMKIRERAMGKHQLIFLPVNMQMNIPNFFTDNYDHPIYECGVQLIDMVYLQRCL